MAWAGRIGQALRLALTAAPRDLAGYLALMLLGAATPVAAAALTRKVVDGLAQSAPAGRLAWQAVGLLLAGLLAALVPAGCRYLRSRMERAIALLAKERLFAAVDRIKGLARFEEPEFLDRLELADESGGRGPNHLIDGSTGVAAGVLTVAGFLGSLLVISAPMALLVLFSGVPLLVAELVLSRHRARVYWEITPAERRELFFRNLLATESAAKEVRLFHLGTFVRERMLAERRSADVAESQMDRREWRVQSALGFLAAAVSGAGLLWAVLAARGGSHSLGDITLFIAAVLGVQSALIMVAQQLARVHQAMLLFGHYAFVVDADPDLPSPDRPARLAPLAQGIELRDVWFRYSEKHPWILRGIDLTLPAGRSTALVGLNGAGKSTVVKLLCRFYDPTRGSICWDGVDLRQVDPDDLRTRISAVFQDYVDYEMTAAESIEVGDLGACPERVHDAAARAGVHHTLAALPAGYDTLLSRQYGAQASVELSGGQRQRIALARAFLRPSPDLVILDEPSSGLDAQAEHEVHQQVTRHRAGRTSLLISHRLGAVRDADHIVVLSGGTVTEQGSHFELMGHGGEYERMFTLQAANYQS